MLVFFFFQAEDGIRDLTVTGVQTCALPISGRAAGAPRDPAGTRAAAPESPSTGCLACRSSTPGASHRRRTTDRKSTRLNSSHSQISYAVFCLKKKFDIDLNQCAGRELRDLAQKLGDPPTPPPGFARPCS